MLGTLLGRTLSDDRYNKKMPQRSPSDDLKGASLLPQPSFAKEDRMKKNPGSKATLHRETLRALDRPELENAVVAGVSIKLTCTCCNGTRLTCSTVFC
jgi:hypothetical protein